MWLFISIKQVVAHVYLDTHARMHECIHTHTHTYTHMLTFTDNLIVNCSRVSLKALQVSILFYEDYHLWICRERNEKGGSNTGLNSCFLKYLMPDFF